jgi:hypothetical protein|tara:strand:- start:269 stop:460 length:192 start_codon:yes stop_codon:yes gene_type:complete
MQVFDGVEVFSGTVAIERERLGKRVTRWMQENSDKEVVEKEVKQSSDSSHHCLTIILYWRHRS